MIKKLSDLVELAKSKKIRRIAVAAAEDMPVMMAIKEAMHDNIVLPILVGDKVKILNIGEEIGFDFNNVEIIDEKDPMISAKIAVNLIRTEKAEILMKGLVNSGDFLKAILNKEKGLRSGATLSHIAFFESPYYHKLLAITDAAMNVEPEFADKLAILNNAIEAFHKLGIAQPKIAIVGAIETVNNKISGRLR